MIRVVLISFPDEQAAAAERLVRELEEDLGSLVPQDARAAVKLGSVQKIEVEALITGCGRLNRDVLTRDVRLVAGVHESEFFKWQRGDHVGDKTRRKCEGAVRLPAEEFLRRLDACGQDLIPWPKKKFA